ncbi:WXG100 family type VII secretion target [Nocardia sp. NPDC003482]
MTDEGYRVDLEHLDAVTARIAGLAAFVAEALQGIDTRIEAAHREWTGAAAVQHVEAHRHWRTGAEEMREGIEAMHAAATTAHANYSAALAANLATLRSGVGR